MDYLKEFENYLRYERQLAESSACQYLTMLVEFKKFLMADLTRPQQFNIVSRTDVLEFLSYLRNDKKINNSTISNYIAALRSYYKWATYTTKNETLTPLLHYLVNIVRIKKPHVVPFVPTLEEITRLRDTLRAYLELSSYDKMRATYKKILTAYTMIELLITTGMRSNELRNLQYKDVDLENKVIFISHGKGGHQRYSIFGDGAVNLFKEYFKIFEFQPNDYIFPIKHPKHINSIVKRWAARAKISTKLHTHSFRHFFITESENRGIPLQIIADQVGHFSLNSTKHYTHLNIQKVRNHYNNKEI
ncbi:MAG: tyrosine-type recombinase/integrase [Candidatus Omnitrophica bacterium]|nr:tyrosine-type recombinase/integrase [Candidatus Omnitrophota bacterium]MDD5592436.1 tyrosine-type recombinase/integrase [Candidatus Omnitrophota bacterium]